MVLDYYLYLTLYKLQQKMLNAIVYNFAVLTVIIHVIYVQGINVILM